MVGDIIDHYPYLSEPKLVQIDLPHLATEYPLASLIECMRIIMFLFIITISMSLGQIASSTTSLLLDVISNFDNHFTRLVPTNLHDNEDD